MRLTKSGMSSRAQSFISDMSLQFKMSMVNIVMRFWKVSLVSALAILLLSLLSFFVVSALRNSPAYSAHGKSDEEKKIEALQREIESLKAAQSSQFSQASKSARTPEGVEEVHSVAVTKNTGQLGGDEIYAALTPAVVFVQTPSDSGSGMIIEPDGLVLTNAHVVKGSELALVKLSNQKILQAVVIGRDETMDVALLKLEGSDVEYPVVHLGDSDLARRGEQLFVFGYPLGMSAEVTFTSGVLSARQSFGAINYIQTDAAIHGGNSGGPLVDRSGEVIGMNTLATKIQGDIGGVGLGFALPINAVRDLIPSLKNGGNIVSADAAVYGLNPSAQALVPNR